MRKIKSNQNDLQTSKIGKILLLTATAISLYFNTANSDPFNSPKMYLLMLSSVWLLSYLLFPMKSQIQDSRVYKTFFVLVISFLSIMFIMALNTDIKLIAFLGNFQRNLGFLTYASFVVYSLIALRYFSFKLKNKFYLSILVISFIYIIYGLMQFTKNDFIKWVNQYNPIIITLGNPNFTSAFMSMLAILTVSYVFYKNANILIRIIYLFITFGLIGLIYLTNSKQGLLSLVFGTSIFLGIQIFDKNRKFGWAFFGVLAATLILAIAGMLQKGPLVDILYKPSITLRGYYWRAGINMLINNPLTGVGIDRYGVNFKLYKDVSTIPITGSGLNSTNAHNVFIQMFATGGFLLGISYVFVISYIFKRGVIGIKNLNGEDKIFFTAIFSSWLAYVSQSIISIDNIGLTIWGWILGGGIVGLSGLTNKENTLVNSNSGKNNNELLRPFFTIVSTMLTLIFVVLISKGEFLVLKIINESQSQNSQYLTQLSSKVFLDKYTRDENKLQIVDLFYRKNETVIAISELEKLATHDPKNQEILSYFAAAQENLGNYKNSINIRTNLISRDPFNLSNYLQLLRLYKDTGDLNMANKMKEKIISLAPTSVEADMAKKEIVS